MDDPLVDELFERMKRGDEDWPKALFTMERTRANCVFVAVLTRFGQWLTNDRSKSPT